MNRFFVFLLMVFFANSLFAQQEDFIMLDNPEILKAGVNKTSNGTSSIHAEFVQEKYMDILENAITSEGSFVFKRPNKLKWEYNKPFKYLIVLNGSKMKIKDEEKTNTINLESSRFFQEINNIIINSVQGNLFDNTEFEIKYFQSSSNYMAKFFTKNANMKEIIDCIEVVFDKSDFDVKKIKLLEPTGDYTSIKFTQRILNKPVDDNTFLIN